MQNRFLPVASTDGYKVYHTEQYPKDCSQFYGNLTARTDKLFKRAFSNNKGTYLAFGMQQAIKEIVYTYESTFFSKPFEEVVTNGFAVTLQNFVGADDTIISKLKKLHDKGYLPITVQTVNEGDLVDINSPCMIVYTEKGFDWLFGYLEPIITNMIWKTITNATTAREFATLVEAFGEVDKLKDNGMLGFLFHDFSSRGLSGMEDSARSGVPHMLYFDGTENLGTLNYIERVYDYDYEAEGLLAGSVRATEHTVSSTNIFHELEKSCDSVGLPTIDKKEAESRFFKRYISEVYPSGFVGYVADTFDFFRFVNEILPEHKEAILARDGKVVIRPDSFSDVVKGIMGTDEYPFYVTMEDADECHSLEYFQKFRVIDEIYFFDKDNEPILVGKVEEDDAGTLPLLFKHFGYVVDSYGNYNLPPQIGIIYGDGINIDRAREMYERMNIAGICISSIILGLGAGVYQWVSRDTLGIAYKVTAYNTESNEEFIPVYKDPKGVNKKSAKGIFKIGKDEKLGNTWVMEDGFTEIQENPDMVTLYSQGKLNEVKFSDIRKNARKFVFA